MTPELLALLLATPVGTFAALAAWLDWSGGRGGGQPVDAIVVAGCRVMPDGRPSPALTRRVRLAVTLFRAGHARHLVLTGGLGRDAPVTEGRAAATLAIAVGVPADAILVEETSVDTLQNAAFAARVWEDAVGRPARDARILVVTDRAHVFRCRRMFGAHFGHVIGAGATPPLRSRLEMAAREGASVLHHGLRGRLRAPPLGPRE